MVFQVYVSNVSSVLHTYVASVLSRCCKSRSGCCIYMHVASVYFKCFICTLQRFHLHVPYVLQWLHTCFPGVSDICCKYSSRCYKSRTGVAHVVVGPTCRSHMYSCCARMHARGIGGARATSAGNEASADRDVAPAWAHRRGK
jgi:hypothetical protein